MKILGIVPARAGSKRLPGKNLRNLGGKPLVAWALEAAVGSTKLNRVLVSSDDQGVLEIARGFEGVTALERPGDLASDTSPAIDYVRHALSETSESFEIVVIVQPTSPLTRSSDIDATIELLLETGADSAVTVVRVAHDVHPLKFKRMEGTRLFPYLEEERGRTAAHDLPSVYVRNCAVYVTRRGVIERGLILGEDCRGFEMPRSRSVDINDEVDFAFADFLLTRGGDTR